MKSGNQYSSNFRSGARIRYLIYLVLLLGILSLLSAIWGGLQRIGWHMPILQIKLAHFHGPLMISGFLGTLISLERAKGLGVNWSYLAPASTGIGALSLLMGITPIFGKLLITSGSLVLIGIFVVIIKRQTNLLTLIMCVGSIMWVAGNILWLRNKAMAEIVPWWTSFLIITIATERFELARIIITSTKVKNSLILIITLLLLGNILTLFHINIGIRCMGIAMIFLAIWLFSYDVARLTVHSNGLSRFIAVSLLSGYFWLGVGGVIAISTGAVSGPLYDAMVHSVFLGFVFSMIFAHAPVIFSAVLELSILYNPFFYIHLVLLHTTLLLRVYGDLMGSPLIRSIGGLLNAVTILAFLVNTAFAIYRSNTENGSRLAKHIK